MRNLGWCAWIGAVTDYLAATPTASRTARDVAALCHHLKLDRVAVVGMSQGARAALRFAIQAPEKLTALILDGPPNFDPSTVDDDVPLAHFSKLARDGGLAAFRREWSGHALVQLCTEATQMRQLVAQMISRYPGRELLSQHAPAAVVAPLQPQRVRAPTLILSGAYDLPSRLQSARLLCTLLPGAEHVILPDAGHLINLDQPALYSQLCRTFLKQHAQMHPP